MLIGIACLAVFLFMALMMYSRKLSALLALPIMAVVISAIGGIPPADVLSEVLNKGAVKLSTAYTTTMFGAMMAELINKQGIAKALVRWVAEFAGDNPFILSVLMMLVTAVLFSTLGGLGAVIMVGTIVLPVLLSLGIASTTAGALYLFGINLGGMFNISGWQLYMGVLGLKQADITSFVLPFGAAIAAIALIFLTVELKQRKNIKYLLLGMLLLAALFSLMSGGAGPQATQAPAGPGEVSVILTVIILIELVVYAAWRQKQKLTANPTFAFITPVVPLILVLFCHWDFIPAFIAGLIFGLLSTWKTDSINVFTRSIIDGIASVIPAVVLMMGIGMLMNAVSHPLITSRIGPMIRDIVPTSPIPYVIVFSLASVFALYRGPLNLWGMGSGLALLMKNASKLSSQALMGMLMSVGQIQGICDPTNTHNIWIATYLSTDTQVLLRKTIVYAWAAVIAGLTIAVSFGYVRG